jgi:hypothetical protein
VIWHETYNPKAASRKPVQVNNAILLGDRVARSGSRLEALRGELAAMTPAAPPCAALQALPGSSFVVNGAVQAHDTALTTVSA